MPDYHPQDLTALLQRSRSDTSAQEVVYRLVYDDLRRIAGHRISESRPGETLSVTSLVNDAYLKLTERTGKQWADRSHFFRVASRAMRQITVDYVRTKLALKRGAGLASVPLESLQLPANEKPAMVIALEEGLEQLAVSEPRLVSVVECRFFAGLTIDETAQALEISHATVERDWARARSWLEEYLT